MEELDAQTIEELKAKAIERGGDETEDITTNEIDEELKEPDVVEEEPVPKRIEEVKKPKRQRSEKQKAAFEKARLARAENLKIKKQIEAEKKQKQKEEKEQVKIEVKKRLSADHSVKPYAEANHPAPASIPQAVEQRYQTEQPRYREQVVNNYYYYGATPSGAMEWQDPEPPPVQKRGLRQGKKKKVVVKEPEPESSSESESASEAEEEIIYSDPEEPEIYKELQNFNEEVDRGLPPPKSNGLKFRFA